MTKESGTASLHLLGYAIGADMFKTVLRHGISLTAAAMVFGATPAFAAADNFTVRDLRCFTLMLPELQNKNAKVAGEAKDASFYFLGRIESRVPLKTLATTMSEEAAKLDKAPKALIDGERQACFEMVAASGRDVVTTMKSLNTPAQ